MGRGWKGMTPAAFAALLAWGCGGTSDAAPGTGTAVADDPAVPNFEVDPFWPQPLPEDWILGQVAGLSIDEQDHVWVVHRPGTVNAANAGAAQDPPVAMCCTPAPEVIELNPAGEVVRAWGRAGDHHDWPTSMHGIHVDRQGHVWLAGNGPDDHFVLKFTREGEFVMQIGAAGANQGSQDTRNLGGPATLLVDEEANELYVADGYQNRRVIVFDATTGEYRRHWGAYGEVPDDTNPGAYDPAAPPSRTFRTPVHGLAISNDGLVYVADRPSNRIQVFQKDGTFVREAFVRPETLSMGSTWYFGFSPDPDQRWLYIPDGTNNIVWILERESLEVVGSFGRGGRRPGQFDWVHDLAVDAAGNIYTTEVNTGHRIQKFNLVGGG